MIFLVLIFCLFRIGVALFSYSKAGQAIASSGEAPLVFAQNEDSVLERSGVEGHLFPISGTSHQGS